MNMEARIITEETIERFHAHLLFEEKSAATVEKYIRDAKAFMLFADGAAITKELVIQYKQKLIEGGYAVRCVNSILASVNSLLIFLGWSDCKVNIVTIIVLLRVLVQITFLYYSTKVNCFILPFRNFIHDQSRLIKKVVVTCSTELLTIGTNEASRAVLFNISCTHILCP